MIYAPPAESPFVVANPEADLVKGPQAFSIDPDVRARLRAAIARRSAMGRPLVLVIPTTAEERRVSQGGDAFLFVPDLRPDDDVGDAGAGDSLFDDDDAAPSSPNPPSGAYDFRTRGGISSAEGFPGLRGTTPWPLGSPLPASAVPGGVRWPAGETPPAWWTHARPPLWRQKGDDARRYVVVESSLRFMGLVSRTSKMSCASWSVPAGALALGGTCPSANVMLEAVRAGRSLEAHGRAVRAFESDVRRVLPMWGGLDQTGLARKKVLKKRYDVHTGEVTDTEWVTEPQPVSGYICDWQCPALAADGHACGNARAPDCTTECRVCWGGRVDRVEDFRQVPVTYAKH